MDVIEWFLNQSKRDKAIIILMAVVVGYFTTGVIIAINK